ncbi:MAG: c-type cytochrome, partial [Candidatus Binatia bacterium]
AAPYVFYNAITFGIDGTAMASFREAFDEQERWDLAFYLWRFVAPEDLPDPADISVSLRDLATRSSGDLVPEVLRQGRAVGVEIDRDAASGWIASRRAYPRPVSDHAERLAEVRRELVASLDMLDGDRLDAAAEQVTSAYLDHFEPLEPDIDRIDPNVRQRFERSLIDFRAALRRGDAESARAVAAELLDTVASAERLFRAPERGLGTLIVLGALGVLLVGGMVVMTLRRG